MRDIKFKLYKDNRPSWASTPLSVIMYNRGIDTPDAQSLWLTAGTKQIFNWKELDDGGKMQRAVSMVQNAISKELDILVIVDCD